MYSLEEFFRILDEYAPLEISKKMIERGDYDNSGILAKCSDKVEKVLFSLDLSKEVVNFAIKNGCDTIVTHHPAIYAPIKELSVDSQTAPITLAVMNKINVISMHLNLDTSSKGIDYYLALALGGETQRVLDFIDEKHGYGREYKVSKSLLDFVSEIKKNLATDKILIYGQGKVEKVASFCGGGASNALESVEKGKTDADTIVTSDIPHHVLKELLELNKKVVIIPHYASEDYGFNRFYSFVKNKANGQIQAFYFEDRRFK